MITIRETQASDLRAIQDFTVVAFEPIFESFKTIMGPKLFSALFPNISAQTSVQCPLART
jgi:hypothetical protein